MGIEHERFETEPCFHLDVEGTWDELLRGRSGHFRKRLKENRIRLDKAGEHRIVRWEESGARSVEDALEDFLAVDAKSWRSDEETTIGGDPLARAFYGDVTAEFASRGKLDLRFLLLDERPVAGILSVVYADTLFGLKTAYDAELRAISPGAHLLASLVRHAHDEGLGRVDFIRGDDALRRRWTDTSVGLTRLVAFSPRGRGRALSFLRRRAVPIARRLFSRSRDDAPSSLAGAS